ncbi:MAG: DUF2779 domain-containing protein [Steroidobacteraceae bacterium]
MKSSTSVKDEHLIDCAIQTWVTEANGIRPQSVALAHIDNQFVYQGDGNYAGLLAEEDITTQIAPHIENVPLWKASADQVLKGGEPSVPVGTHCRSPYVCPFIGHCWPQTEYPLDGLPGIGRRLNDLVAAGYKDVRDVPSHLLKGRDQLRVLRAVRSGKSELLPGAKSELAALGWPRYYLDFETIGFAIPIWAGTRPYQSLPFQWSLHVESSPGQLEHAEFLDVSGAAPMRQCAEALIKAAGSQGPILTYTMFERQCIRTLQSFCPDLAEPLEALSRRLVDLHPIVKKHYYHPAMQGSWSIKAVLPTLVPDMQYGQLEGIQEGMGAQQAFVEAIDQATSTDRRTQLRDQLLAYCGFDTLAMVRVSQQLEGRG